MSTAPEQVAADVYDHELTAPRGGRVRRALAGVVDLVASVDAGPLGLGSVGDVVVRRRDDGVEVLRVTAGPPEEAAATVRELDAQLRTLTPEEFRGRWGIVAG